ncbi:MAG: hypothetical protein SWZ49_29525, partial [Cyanobacteriota bacterium]|nr:hypothetical protein [Cyanobacteriota bacterium]
MSDRQKISRKKGTASNSSNPSLAPKIPSLATSVHDSASESHQTIPKTAQLETSQEFEKAAEEQENQENISLKESSLGNFNILERAAIFRPQETIQRQELAEDKQEQSKVVQRKLNAEELEDKQQEELSPLYQAFQFQGNEENKLDKPIESFNYLENISITRPKQNIQRQELLEDKQEQSEVIQNKLNVSESEDKQSELSPLSQAFQYQGNEENKLDKPIESFNYLENISITRPKQNVQGQEITEGIQGKQNQQVGNALSSGKEEKNPTSPQETADGKVETPSKEETNTASTNSGETPQNHQEVTPQAPGNQEINQESNITVPETTSQSTAPASPNSDPDFQAVVSKTKGVASKEKQHAPAATKAQQAQNAAQSPASELESKAQGNQIGEMEQAPTPGFNAAAFKAKLMERIKEAAPKNLDEADNFKDNNKLGAVKSEMQQNVKQEQTASQTPLEEKAKQAPDTSGIEPKSVTPLPPNETRTATQNINAQKAVPKPKGQNEIETPLQQSSQQLNQQMVEANLTEEQLALSNEPEFQNALAAKQEAQTNANQAPQEYRQFEQNQLTQAK